VYQAEDSVESLVAAIEWASRERVYLKRGFRYRGVPSQYHVIEGGVNLTRQAVAGGGVIPLAGNRVIVQKPDLVVESRTATGFKRSVAVIKAAKGRRDRAGIEEQIVQTKFKTLQGLESLLSLALPGGGCHLSGLDDIEHFFTVRRCLTSTALRRMRGDSYTAREVRGHLRHLRELAAEASAWDPSFKALLKSIGKLQRTLPRERKADAN